MAGKAATLTVKILTDAAGAKKGIDQAASGYEKFQGKVDSLVAPAAATATALIAVGTAAAQSAARTEQAMGALDSVFGANSATVKQWAADAADAVGLSEAQYGELASTIGAQLNNLGLSADAALSGTKDLIGLGADLAATFGGSTTEAVEALSSALRGEADPAERYGLSLSQTAVNAKLAEQGMSGLTGEALTTAKTQAILALATEQAGGAIGQFGREADTASGQTERANAAFQNATAALGEALLPAVTAVTAALADMFKWVSDNKTAVLAVAAVIGTLAAVILTLSAAMKVWQGLQVAWTAATKIATAAQWLYNAALTANPIGLLIAAIAVVIGLIIYLWTTNEGFRNALIAAWQAISDFAVAVWQWIVDAAQAAWDWIMSIVSGALDFVIAYFRFVLSIYVAIWNAIATAAVAVWNWIVSIVSSAINTIVAGVRAAGDWIASVWRNIERAAAIVWNAIASVVNSVIAGIRSTVAAVGSFIAGVWNGILNAGRSVWTTLESIVRGVMAAIMVPINAVRDAFDAIVGAVQDVINWISRIKIPDLSALNPFKSTASTASFASPVGFAAATPVAGLSAGRSGPNLAGALGAGMLRGGTVNVITVHGGLDSGDTIARRINAILTNRDRRAGGVVIDRRAR